MSDLGKIFVSPGDFFFFYYTSLLDFYNKHYIMSKPFGSGLWALVPCSCTTYLLSLGSDSPIDANIRNILLKGPPLKERGCCFEWSYTDYNLHSHIFWWVQKFWTTLEISGCQKEKHHIFFLKCWSHYFLLHRLYFFSIYESSLTFITSFSSTWCTSRFF